MIEFHSGGPGEQRPDDATGELTAGRSVLPEQVRLAGRSRSARLAWSAASALVVVAAVVAAVRYGRHGNPDPAATPPATASAVDTRKPGIPSPLDQVSALAALATTRHFQTFVRQSSNNQPCPAVVPGQDPKATVAAVVAASVPGATVIGASPTIDQFTGLCALNVVLHDPHGGRLTVSVSAPTTVPKGTLDAQQVGLQNVTGGLVEYAMVGWHTGWRVLVGAVGAYGTVPTTAELTVIADAARLLW